MAVKVERDCITKADGSMICWDREKGKLYVLNKREVSFGDVPDEELARLIKRLTSPEVVSLPLTQADVDLLNSAFPSRGGNDGNG